MYRIIIIGNSGSARECYWALQEALKADPTTYAEYEFTGFLSWKGYPANLKELHALDLGIDSEHIIDENNRYIIGVGNAQLRKDIFLGFKERGAKFMTLIHPWTDISPTAQIGEANIFQRGSVVYCNTKIGNANYLNGAVSVAHDATIGDYNIIGPFSMILGNATLGSSNHLGPQCILLDKCHIGDSNHLEPGAIVYKGCKNNTRLMGNPAIRIADANASFNKKT